LKPLHALVLTKSSPAALERERKAVGYFSYGVPEFTWDYDTPGKAFELDTHKLRKRGYDFIFHVDGGCWGHYSGHAIPVVYYVIDSTLSEANHYHPRLTQSRRSDLVLVDHDRIERFAGTAPVARWNYCVNERVFKPVGEKVWDIAYHCNGSDNERAVLRSVLHEYATRYGWSYRSGALGLEEYAESLAAARVVVNQPRVAGNRPHRVYDTLAAGACLLTGFLPDTGDGLLPSIHYETFAGPDTLLQQLKWLLEQERWQLTARLGRRFIMEHHVWSVAAQRLRQILHTWLGI